jgi:hypothetical protein
MLLTLVKEAVEGRAAIHNAEFGRHTLKFLAK